MPSTVSPTPAPVAGCPCTTVTRFCCCHTQLPAPWHTLAPAAGVSAAPAPRTPQHRASWRPGSRRSWPGAKHVPLSRQQWQQQRGRAAHGQRRAQQEAQLDAGHGSRVAGLSRQRAARQVQQGGRQQPTARHCRGGRPLSCVTADETCQPEHICVATTA